MQKNYYELLWLTKWATVDEIKKAYRKKAMEHHPDRWGDAEVFKEINEAYSVLSDENKKREYDTYGRVWGNPFGWWNSGFWWFGWVDVDLWDIFESFFGWWGSSRSRKKSSNISWEDLEYRLKIDLKTSIIWWKTTLKYDKYIKCDDCWQDWWTWKQTCSDCHWTWYVKYRQQTMFWTIEHTGVCEKCNWAWETIEHVCKTCHWNKRIKKSVSYDIEIPAWIDDGMVIKISWEWNDWIKSSSWDLYVKFSVDLSEKNLTRKGYDLHYDLEIDVLEAILWTLKELNIPVIWKRSIKIDAWTQFWSIIKMSWDWVKHIDKDKKWDLFIALNIKIPKKLSETEREFYENLAKEKKINFSNKKWIFEKIFG